MISTERISGGSTPRTTKPAETTSWRSVNPDKNDEPDSGETPIQYFKYGKDDSTPPRYCFSVGLYPESNEKYLKWNPALHSAV